MKIADLDGKSVLDFGCGTGSLADWLARQSIDVRYTGVDLLPEFFDVGKKKHPKHQFGFFEDFKGQTFDYCFVSGVFNNAMKDNRGFYQSVLRDLFAVCTDGIAFNMMSTYVDYQDEHLFYEDPGVVFRFAKTELSPFVVLRHDYEVKPDVVPFEYAVYVYKKPSR